jgi:hypothetical protein
MEELGLPEDKAEAVLAKCSVEARLVAAEQEIKKAADARKKADDKAAFEGGMRHASAEAPPAVAKTPETEEIETEATGTPSGMESAPGGSPETIVHDEKSFANADELSPEEQAVHGQVQASMPNDLPDEDADGKANLSE